MRTKCHISKHKFNTISSTRGTEFSLEFSRKQHHNRPSKAMMTMTPQLEKLLEASGISAQEREGNVAKIIQVLKFQEGYLQGN